jgi:hypothetical protein
MTATSRVRPILPLLVAALHIAVLIWQAPHTVHHFFEHELEKQNECALSAAAERSSGTTVDVVGIAPVTALELSISTGAPVVFRRLASSVLGPRAPPPTFA